MIKKINNIIAQALGADLDNKIKNYFITGAYKSIVLQASIAIITFLSALFIARITGDRGFGVYTTIFTWISIVSVGATLGLDDLLLKKMPIYKERKEPEKIKAILIWTNYLGLAFSLLCVAIFFLFVQYSSINGLTEYANYYFWAVWVIPLFVLMHINQAALRGLKLLWWGQLAEKFVQPIAFFLFLIVFYFASSFQMTDLQAIIARSCSFVITAIISLYLLWKHSAKYCNTTISDYQTKEWTKSIKYFAVTSLFYIINTRIDIIFLGFYKIDVAQIAYYNAALKLSDIALIPFSVLYTVAAPMFSELYARGDKQKLQSFYTNTTRLSCLLITVILLVLLFWGEFFLGLFGSSFKMGYSALVILCGVKFIHILIGPANYLMMMVGLEKQAAWILLFSLFITIILNTVLIPIYQIEGAAIASLGGFVIFEFLITYITYQKSGIMPTIFGNFLKKK